MTDHANRYTGRHGTTAIIVIAVMIVGGVLLLWSWNTIAVEMFDAPSMRFKHALAVEFTLGTIFATHAVTRRLFGGGERNQES